MRIYTKTGDKGKTGLLSGDRVAKDNIRIQAYGTVDECNAVLGIVRTYDIGEELDSMLEYIQNRMFVVGSDLATPGDKKITIERIDRDATGQLEEWIDRMENSLTPLKQFILPGGTRGASFLHLARTVCRRAERMVVGLARQEQINPFNLQYLNRLSDLLFVMGRFENRQKGIDEPLWNSRI